MTDPIEYKIARVSTRSDIPNPPVPGTEYRIASERVIAATLSNGMLEEYGGSGTTDYDELTHKPTLNGVELVGNLTAAELSLASETTYTHVQSASAATWNIQHNLGKKFVEVILIDDNDEEIVGEEDWGNSTANLLVVNFSEPVSGSAYVR